MPGAANTFASDYRLAWLGRELAPFPGREITTLRILVAVLIVVTVSLTLQVPLLFFSAFFVFFVTKENHSLTLLTGLVMVVGATIAMSVSLFLFRFTFDYPELRVPVMAGLVFTGMFLSRVFFIGPLGFVIGFFAALTQTQFEGSPNPEAMVRGTLWLWVALIYPIVLTVIINLTLLPAHPWDALVRALKLRLAAATNTLQKMLREGRVGGQTNPELLDLATRGNSTLCTLLNYSVSADPGLKPRRASLLAVIAASEHLISATAALEYRTPTALTEDDQRCAEALLVEILRLQNALGRDHPNLPPYNADGLAAPLAHLRELQSAVKDFHASLAGDFPADTVATPPPAKKHLFIADAFTNPAHVHFALKVTLAAMVCYLIYTGLAWPGISTCFITCCFIALGNTGATMRKAWLRLLGCSAGGLLGFLCIMWLIPHMESIVSLLLLTAVGTIAAAWVATGSDRISYAGLQGAFAFYMCLFQGYAPETNFTTIRDRVVGIVIGIIVSSTVFRYVWPEHAIDALRLTLAQVLRNVAKLLQFPKTEAAGKTDASEINKIHLDITRGLDNSLHYSEVMLYEPGVHRQGPGFSPFRLQHLVADTQALSLMATMLLGHAKREEWEHLEKPIQEAELALRSRAADQLQQIAAAVENRPTSPAGGLPHAYAVWNQTVPHFTPNDRPRLIRRVVEQIKEMS
jgi:multidrug resistance protein MdtO